MFDECCSLISLRNISKWNISNFTFYECISLLSLPDGSNFKSYYKYRRKKRIYKNLNYFHNNFIN